ncbi:MAG: UDP-N-acetylmuramoyl-tripeptide--D-alanyl-D-alanine ligase [Odoribacter sp.]|nr:UDP-N-acetylmuramoyl-tripeptide--D-alanyl-D-alanine ligase [Odoribacter sp.]
MNIADLYHEIRGHRVTTDSRNIQAGDVFIALKGENFDGNLYATEAIQKGAILAIVDNPDYVTEQCRCVPDTLVFLQELARHHRRQLGIPILGITGTNGKTTTKELCHAVLSRKFKTFATQGNFNNHIGVPLTLLSMDETTEFGIVEMGANHPGEIKTLCDIAEPDYGIITNIGQAHLEGFGTPENIIATKRALYDYVAAKNGKLFVNSSDSLLMNLSEKHNRSTYGKTGDLLQGDIKQTVPYLVFSILTPKGQLYIKTNLVGGYNFDNAMAASAIGCHFGIDPLDIQAAIENYHPSNLRSQLIRTESNTVILDAYNANPSSMQVSVSNFMEMPGDNKILILGEMLELGAESQKAHRQLLELALSGHFNKIFLIGNNFEHCADQYNFITWFKETDALIETLKHDKPEQAFIFVKGSRGNRLERIVEYL